jgi:hypothetical protein
MSLNAQHRIYQKKQRLPIARIATIAVLGSLICFSQAFGQAQPPVDSSSAAAISDQKLKAAATAIPQVETIRQTYEQQLAQAPSNDKSRIQSQAGTEMKKAIADQGLSVAEYNTILQTAEQNPDIRGRLVQAMPQQDHTPGP